MNNLQLSVLLDKYSDLLWAVLASILAELPDELKETVKEEEVYAPILQPLRNMLFDLDHDVKILREGEAT